MTYEERLDEILRDDKMDFALAIALCQELIAENDRLRKRDEVVEEFEDMYQTNVEEMGLEAWGWIKDFMRKLTALDKQKEAR